MTNDQGRLQIMSTSPDDKSIRVSRNFPGKALGRLVFEDSEKPLHNMPVELWGKFFLLPAKFLASGLTDREGNFELPYNLADVTFRNYLNLQLRAYETSHTYGTSGEIVVNRHLVYTVKNNHAVDGEIFDFGTCRIPYWKYDPSTPLIRVYVEKRKAPPEEYTAGHGPASAKCIGGLGGIWVNMQKHRLINLLNPNWPSLATLQASYPENRTRMLERQRPGYTRGDEYFGQQVLNGFNPCLLRGDKERPGWYRFWLNWDAYEQDGIHDLPNVDARFEIKDDKLMPVQITVQFRKPGGTAPHCPLQEPMTFTPDDGDRWLQAKRIFRVCNFVGGEIDIHLVRCHLNVEQYAIAARRNLRKNPLRHLLFPHLKEVTRVNQEGNELIFGETGVLNVASALTPKAILNRFIDQMAGLDWRGWKPRRVLCKTHNYAKAANVFWEVFTEYVNIFFEENREGILEHWLEIHRFSQDLVTHSLPYAPLPSDPGDDWFDANELDDPGIPRPKIDGVYKAVRPFTLSDEPAAGDIENLKQVCRYVIFHAAFAHAWSNARQFDECGEVLYASLGLRNGSLAPEDDLTIAPTPREAGYQLFLAKVLSGTRYGMIMSNEDRDIPPVLLDLLHEKEEALRECEVDIYDVQGRINI
jgi:hypothetical protein